MPVSIAVYSDVICPWCYVGKRRLERALDQLDLRSSTDITWLPFELNPDMPAEGIERAAYRERKFGSARSAVLDAEMTARGVEEGIAFRFDRMSRTPNTRRAHMLIAEAGRQGRSDPVVVALFRAYFEEARDIGDSDVLIDIAAAAGMPREDAARCLVSEEEWQAVVAAERQASEMNISGVPFFIVDKAWAVSGAQPPESWVAALSERVHASAS